MNHEIRSIDAKTEEIKKQIVVLRNNPSEKNKQKIMELNLVLDDLLTARNNITQNYLSEIENAIKEMKSEDLTSIMQEKDVSAEEAKKDMFNIIMSTNGLDLEAFYETVRFLSDNEIGQSNLAEFKQYLREYQRIQNQIDASLTSFKQKKQPILLQNSSLTAQIKKLENERRGYLDAISGLEKIISEINGEDLYNLSVELSSAKTKYDILDSESLETTIELLTLRKETGLKKLFHKKKLADKQKESFAALENQETQKDQIISIEEEIRLAAKTLYDSLSSQEIEAISAHAIKPRFQFEESILNTIEEAIKNASVTQFTYFRDCLKDYAFNLTHQIAELRDKQAPFKPVVEELVHMEMQPLCYREQLHISLADKVTHEVILEHYPCIKGMTDNDIDTVINVELEPSTLCLGKHKSKTKTINRTKKGMEK